MVRDLHCLKSNISKIFIQKVTAMKSLFCQIESAISAKTANIKDYQRVNENSSTNTIRASRV